MDIPQEIFKSYDIRGIYPDQLNEENIVLIVRAIYKLFLNNFPDKKQLSVVLGRDMRVSSPALFEVAKNTLVNLGATVVDVGLVSTPTFYFAVFTGKYDGGIQISASHNPKEYNGMKIVRYTPRGLIKVGKSTGMDDIKKMSMEGVSIEVFSKGSVVSKEGMVKMEVENALRIAGNPQIKKFKIVADPANSMGATYIEELFKRIPGELIKMNFELDGIFPAHQADPLQAETLIDLQKKVVEGKADLGLAPDGDGDRLFFIDEKGQIVQPSFITALVARELLKKNKGETILSEIRYILTPKRIVEELGGTLVITKVGHAFITEKLHETKGIFAGESSGHYFFRETGNAESQIPIILIVLKVMTEEGKKLSEIIESLRRSNESGEFNFKVKNAPEIMEAVKKEFSDGEVNELDGVAVSYSDWRLSIRSSNTEPLLRLNVEADLGVVLEEKKQKVMDVISKHAIFEEGNHSH